MRDKIRIPDREWSANLWSRIKALVGGCITQETDPTVPSWAKQSSKPSYTAAEVGAIPASQKGAAGGVAELDSGGKVPIDQLPYMVDTTANWATRTSFVPDNGTIIVYTDKDTVTEGGITKDVPGFKIGDGNAYVVDLPFVDAALEKRLMEHINDTVVHVTSAERTFWNNKLNLIAVGENLQFNRN